MKIIPKDKEPVSQPKKNRWITIEQATKENAFTKLAIYTPAAVEKAMTKEKIEIIKHVNMLNDYKLICVVSHKWSLLYIFRHQNWFQKLFNL